MKTFTVRDLDRTPGEVLEASRLEGRVRIRARSGQTYILAPESTPARRIMALPCFSERRSKVGKGMLSLAVAQQLDKAIAGE